MMKRRFFTCLSLCLVTVTSLTGVAYAEPLPTLPKMMKDIEGAYHRRGGQLAKTSRELITRFKKAEGNPSPSLFKQWKEFQQGAKQEKLELRNMQQFLFRNLKLKQPVHVPSDERYKKLHRLQHLGHLLNVGDFWVKTGLGQYSDMEVMQASWMTARALYQKEKQALENDEFIKAGAVSSTVRKTNEKNLTVVEVAGRAQRRALQKARKKKTSVLDQSKRWKELTPEEKAEIIVPQ